MTKILQLSTYPIANPLHGGQIRVFQIKKFFEAKNCIVKSVSLTEAIHRDFIDDDFIINSDDIINELSVPLCTDYATAMLCVKGEQFKFLKNKICDFMPDIVFLEQPWLYPAIVRLVSQKRINPKIVYSSQNVEYITKQSLLSSHGVVNAKKAIDDIYNLEKHLCMDSSYVVACTEGDAKEFSKMGAKNILICPNGVVKRDTHSLLVEELRHSLSGRKFVLFIGSAYPPNAIGFWKMMGESMAWLPPECIIITAGGVSEILENYMPKESLLFAFTSLDRIKRIGFVTEELLHSLIELSSVIILPITVGGGSNLKTAEAIASNRPIVATTTAFRGYDFADKLSNTIITDDTTTFIDAVLNFLVKDTKDFISDEENALRQSVYWESTLQNIGKILDL